MYVEVENKFVIMKVYDDGTFIVDPKKQYAVQFQNDLSAVKEGKMDAEEFERKYGIDNLKKEAINKYQKILPEIEKAVNEFESFVKLMEALL